MELNYSLGRIRCRSCRVIIRPPYTTCRDGHLVCSVCCCYATSKEEDRVIKSESEKIELSFLDEIFADILDNCQFDCGHRGKLMTLREHELSCKNRLRKRSVKCLMESCDWSDVLDKLADHVSEDHPNCLVVLQDTPEQGFSVNFKNPTMLITQFSIDSFYNELFRLNLLKNGASRRIVVQHVGHTGPGIDIDDTMNEFTISESNMKHFKVGIISNVDIYSLAKNTDVGNASIDITALEDNNYLVKLTNKNSKKIPQDMMKSLECEICNEPMRGKIPQCDKGHSICQECAKMLILCPKCNARMSTSRNYFLEQFLESYDVACKFSRAGCRVNGPHIAINNHSLNCAYRSTKCMSPYCEWTGLIKDFTDHIEVKHPYSIILLCEPYYYYLKDNNLFQADHIVIYDQLFLFTVAYLNEFVYFSVFHLTDGKSDFKFSVTLYNSQTGSSVAFSRPCFTGSAERIKNNLFMCDNSFIISRKFVKDVLCHENEYYSMINIYRNICE